jgi:hypothetical protein
MSGVAYIIHLKPGSEEMSIVGTALSRMEHTVVKHKVDRSILQTLEVFPDRTLIIAQDEPASILLRFFAYSLQARNVFQAQVSEK